METLIIHPKNEEQPNAVKAAMNVLKIDFDIEQIHISQNL